MASPDHAGPVSIAAAHRESAVFADVHYGEILEHGHVLVGDDEVDLGGATHVVGIGGLRP